MKKINLGYIMLIMAAIVPAFLISCNKDEDIKLDFELKVPDNWTYVLYANEGYVYAAARNPVDEKDTLTEQLNIIKTSFPGSNLDLFYLTAKTQLVEEDFYDSLRYESDTAINGTDFVKLVSNEFWTVLSKDYSDTAKVDVITERYFFYENQYAYSMTFLAVDSIYPSMKPVFNSIMSTFKYKK